MTPRTTVLNPRDRRSRPEDAIRILAQRGLRVRMGMHSGLTDPHAISINKASGRTQYTGEHLGSGALLQRTALKP